MLFSLRGLLRREFEVFTAGGGREAIEVLRDHPIHVIMTDQRMPEMTGVEFLNRAKLDHPEAIRVIFTGYADTRALIDAINQANVYRFVAKPWDPDELIGVLRTACGEYQRIVERKRLSAELAELEERCTALADSTLANGPDSTPDADTWRDARQLIGSLPALLERTRHIVCPDAAPVS
jgi:DNA-binding NtrC family response regulator